MSIGRGIKYPGSTRRTTNFWDPIHDPSSLAKSKGRWKDLGNSSSYENVFFFNEAHAEIGGCETSIVIVKNHKFFNCDFRGYLEAYSQVVFIECYFYKCDFGLSWLNNVKITSSEFSRSSFTQCNMNGSEFRKTSWYKIGFSGNETVISDCYITNPESFLSSMFSKTKENKFEKFRKLATQATVSRGLIIALKKHGSEGEFYQSVRAYEYYQGNSRIAEADYNEKKWTKAYRFVQYKFLQAFGVLNSWGKNPLKPLLFLLANFGVFTLIYTSLFHSHSLFNGIEKSFNISVLAGYAVEATSAKDNDLIRVIQAVQFLISLLLYTVFFTTLVGRLSRVKQ